MSTEQHTVDPQEHVHDVVDESPGFDLRELLHLHPRLLLAATLITMLMVPVGMFLAALGVWVLKVSGGAAQDTSVVVAMAGFLVADFWGGGLVAGLTGARARQVAMAWTVVRLVLLLVVALVAQRLAWVLPIELVLAIPASWAGARAARKQAQLRRQARAERAAASARSPRDS